MCLLQLGQILSLHSKLLLPDIPSFWSQSVNDNSDALPALTNAMAAAFEKIPISLDDLHLGYRWHTHEDVLSDLKLHASAIELRAQAAGVLLAALKQSTNQNWIGFSKAILEELLDCAAGSHDSMSSFTQAILHGFQSYTNACRLRTHLAITTLMHCNGSAVTPVPDLSCKATNPISSSSSRTENPKPVRSRAEALLRQLFWLIPSLSSDYAGLSQALGFVSDTEPSSYVEQLAWAVQLRQTLTGGKFVSRGGLASGAEDHCITASPWISSCKTLLFTKSPAWTLTDVKLSVATDPTKSLTSALSSLPGATTPFTRSWNVLLMEHSSDYRFLYVSLPLGGETRASGGSGNSSIGLARRSSTGKSSGKGSQFLHLRIETSRMQMLRAVMSWKIRGTKFDEYFRHKRNMLTGECDESNISDYAALSTVLRCLGEKWIPTAPVRRTKLVDGENAEETKLLDDQQATSCSLGPFWQSLCASAPSANGLVILADLWLAEIPLDALLLEEIIRRMLAEETLRRLTSGASSQLQRGRNGRMSDQKARPGYGLLPFGWISRDFSIQLLCSRLSASKGSPADLGGDSSVKPSARKPDSHGTRMLIRHPLLREPGGKSNTKTNATPNVPGALCVNSSAVRYIIDPYADSTSLVGLPNKEHRVTGLSRSIRLDSVDQSPAEQQQQQPIVPLTFADHVTKLFKEPIARSHLHTSHWVGVIGQVPVGYAPATDEIYSILNECTESLFYYTTESLLAQIPPGIVSNLPLSSCRFAGLFDRVHTPASLLRYGNAEVAKTVIERELEQPISASILLTLAGCQSVSMPALTLNATKLQNSFENLMKLLLDDNRPVGQSILLLQLRQMLLDQECRPTSKCLGDGVESVGQGAPTESNLQLTVCQPEPDFRAFHLLFYGLPNVVF